MHAANAIATSRMQSLDTGWREMGRERKWRIWHCVEAAAGVCQSLRCQEKKPGVTLWAGFEVRPRHDQTCRFQKGTQLWGSCEQDVDCVSEQCP